MTGTGIKWKNERDQETFLFVSCQRMRQNVPSSKNRLPVCSDWLQNGEGPSAQKGQWSGGN